MSSSSSSSSSKLSIEERLTILEGSNRELQGTNRELQDTVDYQHSVLRRLLSRDRNHTDNIDELFDMKNHHIDSISILHNARIDQRTIIRRLQQESRRDEDMIEHVQNQVEKLQERSVKDNFVSLPSSSQKKIQGKLKRDDDNDDNINNGNETGALKRRNNDPSTYDCDCSQCNGNVYPGRNNRGQVFGTDEGYYHPSKRSRLEEVNGGPPCPNPGVNISRATGRRLPPPPGRPLRPFDPRSLSNPPPPPPIRNNNDNERKLPHEYYNSPSPSPCYSPDTDYGYSPGYTESYTPYDSSSP